MNVTIAIDGGQASFSLQKGKFQSFHHGVGPLAPIKISQADEQTLKAGDCSNCWFSATILEDVDPEFLTVRIVTPANGSANFLPEGFPGYHVDPGQDRTFTWNRVGLSKELAVTAK